MGCLKFLIVVWAVIRHGVGNAHELADSLYDPLPEGLFEYKFDWDPTILLFVIMALFYFKGLRAFKGPIPVAKWQICLFYLGITINIAALSPPIDPLSDRLFFVHMIQHMMVVSIGVPLMLFGVPYVVILRGMSPWVRRNVYLPVIKSWVWRQLSKVFGNPFVNLILYEVNFWFWHIPRYYNWALLNDFVHLLEHALMAWTALFLWRNIIDPAPMKSQIPIVLRMFFLLAMTILDSILSAALTYSEEIWYAYEGIPMPKWWANGWTHLDDQILGGLIMWVIGGLLLFVSMSVCFFVWMGREQAKDIKLLT